MDKSFNEYEPLLTEARLSSSPAEALIKFYDLPTLIQEKRHFYEFNCVDLAHTVMLAEQNIITKDVARVILKGLLELRDVDPCTFPMDPLKGSFLLQVEAFLFARMGEDISGQMHTGRSRIDQGATVRRLYERNHILDVLERLNSFHEVLIIKAARHSRTIMPGYTHMQHAQPWIFGHYLLSIVTRLSDDFTRLTESYARVNLNPLGAVGLAGTTWPLDRHRTTELLGFAGLLDNSKLGREAYFSAETIGALSIVMSTLNDLATDLHIWSTTEFGFVESDDAYCGTSSIFPQKKNPAGLEAIKKAAGESVTWLSTALGTFRAEGTGDQAMRDLPYIDDALETTEGMIELFTGIIETLIVHEDRMQNALSGSWCTASNLADTIVRETRLSFRQAHHIVARLVRICLSENIMPTDVNAKILNRAAQQTISEDISINSSAVRGALDPSIFVQTRVTIGSVAPKEIDRMLEIAKVQLSDNRAWLASERTRISQANAELYTAIDRIMRTKLE